MTRKHTISHQERTYYKLKPIPLCTNSTIDTTSLTLKGNT